MIVVVESMTSFLHTPKTISEPQIGFHFRPGGPLAQKPEISGRQP